jgi:predicted TPR repeat methyltransferase
LIKRNNSRNNSRSNSNSKIESVNVTLIGVDLSQQMLEKASKRGKNNDCYDSLIVGDALDYLHRVEKNSIDVIIAADVFIYIGDLLAFFQAAKQAFLENNGLLVFTVEELEYQNSFQQNYISNPNPNSEIVSPANTELNGIDSINTSTSIDINDKRSTNHLNSSDEKTEEEESSIDNIGGEVGSGLGSVIESKSGFRLLPCGQFGHSDKYIRSLAKNCGFSIVIAKKEVLRSQSGVPVQSITFALATNSSNHTVPASD